MQRMTRRGSQVATGALAVVILGLVVWRTGPARVLSSLHHVDGRTIAIALLLNVPVVAIRSVRTSRLLEPLGHRLSLWTLTQTQLAGQTLSWLTPAAGGDLVRAYLWQRSDGVLVRHGIVVVMVERIYSFLLLATVGAAFFAPTVLGPGAAAGVIAACVAASLLPLPLVRLGAGRALLRVVLAAAVRLPYLRRRALGLRVSAREAGELLGSPGVLLPFLVSTLAVFVLSGLQIWVLARGLGQPVTLAAAVGAFGLSQAGGSLSALPFGLGASDALVVACLARAGMAVSAATSLALLVRGAVTVPTALASLTVLRGYGGPAAAVAPVGGQVVPRFDDRTPEDGAETAEDRALSTGRV